MRIGDKVFHNVLKCSGVIDSELYYRYAQNGSGVLVLSCIVEFTHGKDACYLEDLSLDKVPQVSQFQRVQVSMMAERYYGMTGIVMKVQGDDVWVNLYGYDKPIKFHIDELEPLDKIGTLELWLDGVLTDKDY